MLTHSIYYLLKPLIPRELQISLRRRVALWKRDLHKHVWPTDEKANKPPEGWSGWPEAKRFALVLTHDVDTAKGQERCAQLAALEENFGFRSSFNFIAEEYHVSAVLRSYLIDRGFEIGVHGLTHNGNPFRSKKIFQEQAIRINQYLKDWNCVGHRSPCMYHNLDWIGELNIDYDASTFDTDPFEPQPDGMGTIFPFWVSSNNSSNPSNLSRLPCNEYVRGLPCSGSVRGLPCSGNVRGEMGPAPCSVEATTSGSLFHWAPSNPSNLSREMRSLFHRDSINSINSSNSST